MPASSFLEGYEALKAACDQDGDKNRFLKGLRSLLAEATNSNDEPWSLFFRARIASEESQYAHAVEILDRLIALGGDHPQGMELPPFLWAPINKGICLDQLDRPEEAIKVYDDVIARYGACQEISLAGRVAKALLNKGISLAKSDRPEEAIKVYDDVVARFGGRREILFTEVVVKALANKGICLGGLDRLEEAIKVCDEVVAQFGTNRGRSFNDAVVRALGLKALVFEEQGRNEAALESLDEAISRCDADSSLQSLKSSALVHKSGVLEKLHRKPEAAKARIEAQELAPDSALVRQAGA